MLLLIRGSQPELIQRAVQRAQNDPGGYIGPWLMALVGISFMLGILAVQSARYFSVFGYEGLRMFTLVVSCILLSLAQWVLIIQASLDWFAYHFGNWERFSSVPWESPALQLVSRLTSVVAQLFFVHRCYLLYNRNKLVFTGLVLGLVTTLALFGVIGVAIATNPLATPLPKVFLTPALSVNLATDLAITGLTLWKLGRRGGQTYSPNTESVLRRLRNATVEAAVPPAICAILNMVVYLTMKNLTHHWFVMMTSRFYVWSLMFTLNSRVAIRRQLNSPNRNDDKTLSTGFQFANPAVHGSKYQQGDIEKTAALCTTKSEPAYITTSSGLLGNAAPGRLF